MPGTGPVSQVMSQLQTWHGASALKLVGGCDRLGGRARPRR